MIEELLTPKDVRRILRCSLPYVYKLADRGALPVVRLSSPGPGTTSRGALVRFKPQDVLDFIQRGYRPSDRQSEEIGK